MLIPPNDPDRIPQLYDSKNRPIVPRVVAKEPPRSSAIVSRLLRSPSYPFRSVRHLLGFSTVAVSTAAALLYLVPWLKVEASVTSNTQDPYATRFLISNLSPLLLQDTAFGCAYPLIYFGEDVKPHNTVYGNPEAFWSQGLASNITIFPFGQHSITCPETFSISQAERKLPVQRLRYIIRITFGIWPFPKYKITRTQKFDSFRDNHGEFHWYPVSEWSPPRVALH